MTNNDAAERQPWGSLHETHSGIEADWCRNCRDEQSAADQLRAHLASEPDTISPPTDAAPALALLDAALAAERRATVERIRAAVGPLPEYEGDIVPVLEGMTRLLNALDAEAER